MLSKMSYTVMILLVVLVNFASSMECPGCSVSDSLIESFNDTAVSDFVLKKSGSVARMMDCAVMCSRDIRCRSYRHNVQTATCSTYGAGYSLPENTINTVTAEAGSRLYTMCGPSKSFGSGCSVESDCDFANSACLSNSCSCKLGLSYDVWTGDCLERCATYGDWFTLYPDVHVEGFNVKKLTVMTRLECAEACRHEDVFVCVNAEYREDRRECQLCDVTGDVLAGSLEKNNKNWVLYYRHCG